MGARPSYYFRQVSKPQRTDNVVKWEGYGKIFDDIHDVMWFPIVSYECMQIWDEKQSLCLDVFGMYDCSSLLSMETVIRTSFLA